MMNSSQVFDAISLTSGEDFFDVLAGCFCSNYAVDSMHVALFADNDSHAMVTIYCGGAVVREAPAMYFTSDSFCQDLIKRGQFYCPFDAARNHPEDFLLNSMGANSCFAVPLRDESGEMRGAFAVMGSQRLGDDETLLSQSLNFFAPRVYAEALRKQMEVELRHQLWLTQSALDSIPTPIFFKDKEGAFSGWNKAFDRFCGLSESPGNDRVVLEGYWGTHREEDRKLLSEGGELVVETSVERADGDERKVLLHKIGFVKKQGGSSAGLVGSMIDVTELRKAEKKVDYLERYDRLTGLPNQRLFQEHLKAEIAHSKRQQSHLAVFAIDLDFFKKINAVFGHDLGDELLKDVAQRIKGCIRTEDTLARFGGDSFILMLRNIRYDEDASIVAEKILHSFCLPFQIQQQDVFASVSIGVALFPLDGADVRTLIRNSDAALHRAKEMGRNAYLFFASEMNKRVVEQMELQNSLQHALKRDEFVLHYQPQLDALSGDMIGVEALLRWRHPKRGLIYPNDFIPLAEQTGLILSIEEWVLRTACLAAKSWNEQGDELLRVSVNLSPHQFQRQDVFEMVRKIVAETGVQPEWLGLEITESTVMKDVEHAVDMFQQLKDLGLHLSVDDFGTGYSSLSYLKKFPIDLLKIDRSFITDIPAECDDIAIVSAIISMAHKLEIKVLAEGVETAAQKDFLHSVKCDEFQGFYFSTPVVANTVTLKRQDALETRPS